MLLRHSNVVVTYFTSQWLSTNVGSRSQAHMVAHTENVTSDKCVYLC